METIGTPQTSEPRLMRRRDAIRTAVASWGMANVATGEGSSVAFRAGASQVDITLPLGVSNNGIILRGGPVKRIHDPMSIRCLVLDDGVTQMALAICDLRMIERAIVDRGKTKAAEALGWPVGNLLVSATHTHAAPGLVGKLASPLDEWYAEMVSIRIADAIRLAVAQLQPARIGWTSLAKPEHLFNRRWFVGAKEPPMNPFGEKSDRVVMNPGRALKPLEPAGPVDPLLSLVSVQTADGGPLSVLANYGLHYVGGYQDNQASADYFGCFSRRLAELVVGRHAESPFVAMMTNGASGDVNNVDVLKSSGPRPPWTHMRTVANDLAEATAEAMRGIEYHTTCRLEATSSILPVKVRRPTDQQIDWARDLLGKNLPASSSARQQTYAREIVQLIEQPDETELVLQAFRLGELAIAACPCEVFAETGLALRQASSAKQTFTIELANGYAGYLPTPRQHALGGYETWLARSSFLEVTASEKIQAELLRLIGG